jgi:hypothetical protein
MLSRSRLDKGPKYKKGNLRSFKNFKAVLLKVLIPHCLEFMDVTPGEYLAIKKLTSQFPHIRYKSPRYKIQDIRYKILDRPEAFSTVV